MEDGAWKRAVASGRIPEWVAAQRYVVIGYGSAEMRTQPWEYLYRASFLLTAVCSVASLALVLRSSVASLRSRRSAAPREKPSR